MWYVIDTPHVSDRKIIAWERDVKLGYVAANLNSGNHALTLNHRTASRLASAMNAEIKRNET